MYYICVSKKQKNHGETQKQEKITYYPTNPHDSLFKLTFGTLEIARDYMKTFFPPELSSGIDYKGMRLVTNTFIDATLRNHL